MPVDRTGVATAAEAAGLALELLSEVIEVSRPARREEWLAATRREGDKLRRAVEEDVAAYNRYLNCVRGPEDAEELERALRGTIEVPMAAARAALAGIELCEAIADFVRASVAADLGVATILLDGAVRGIGLCVDANLRIAVGLEAAGAERRNLERRAQQAVRDVLMKIAAHIT